MRAEGILVVPRSRSAVAAFSDLPGVWQVSSCWSEAVAEHSWTIDSLLEDHAGTVEARGCAEARGAVT